MDSTAPREPGDLAGAAFDAGGPTCSSPSLRITDGSGTRSEPLMGRMMWSVGRKRDNAIILHSEKASRQHALIQQTEPGVYMLIDLGSRNGSYINDRRVATPTRLRSGDRIALADVTITFVCDAPERAAGEDDDMISEMTMPNHERRTISVLVIDIRDYTVMSQQLPVERMAEVMGRWYQRAGSTVSQRGSWAEKFIGDAVMGVWKHEQAGIDCGRRVVTATLAALDEIRRATVEINKAFDLATPLRIGGGVSTGEAMVGAGAAPSPADFEVLGDTVNRAFRLESATKALGSNVVIGEATFALLRDADAGSIFAAHEVQLKGFDGKQRVYTTSFAELQRWLERVETC